MTQRKYAIISGYCTIALVWTMILAKGAAYAAGGSPSILSSLMDSLLDSIISVTALASIYYASRPADDDHRWGHGKMEAVSALFQAAMIAAGAVFIIFEALGKIITPVKIEHFGLGMGVMVFSIVVSVVLVAIQKFALSKEDSLALEADNAHYGSDIFVNLGVLAVLFLGQIGAPQILDPLFAICVAVYLFTVSRSIGMKSVNMLMDRELPIEQRHAVVALIEAQDGVCGWHDLRMNNHGLSEVISFDIEVDGDLILRDAHAIAKTLENKILEIFPKAEILIHIDPQGDIDDARHRVKGVHH